MADVPQEPVVGRFLFVIYINDIPDGIASLCKVVADETSIFFKVNYKNDCNIPLNSDKNNDNIQVNSGLEIISKWAFQ